MRLVGLGEIGKNTYGIEYQDEIIIVDAGIKFPEDDLLGIDYVIPDYSYIVENVDRVKALVVTHGHEDHIGGLPFLLGRVNIPIYGTALTLGLVGNKLKEHSLYNESSLNRVNAGETIKLGCMSVEFIHVNHSIPDAVAFAIRTPQAQLCIQATLKLTAHLLQAI